MIGYFHKIWNTAIQDFFTEFENMHFWPYTVPPKLACIVINRKMYRISHIEEKKGWKLFFKSEISDLADPIELKLGNYLHLICILGPMRDFSKILTFFHFSGLCSNFGVLFLQKKNSIHGCHRIFRGKNTQIHWFQVIIIHHGHPLVTG